MKRSVYEVQKMKYQKNIVIKSVKPRFFWNTCQCCGNEFKKETMYRCTYQVSISGIIFETFNTEYGCTDCFHSPEEFKDFLWEKGYLDSTYC